MSIMSCRNCGSEFQPKTKRQVFCQSKCNYQFRDQQPKKKDYEASAERRERDVIRHRAKYRADVLTGGASGAWLSRWAEYGKGEEATCTAPGCDRVMFSKLFCRAHYNAEFGYDFGNDYQRRAERWGVEYESFSRADIFDRDGWVCGICSESIDRDLLHPDSMSVSLDHIIPMSKGGGHVPLNVTCAHLFCNLSKGNRHEESGSLVGAA